MALHVILRKDLMANEDNSLVRTFSQAWYFLFTVWAVGTGKYIKKEKKYTEIVNTELNDLRIIICLRKSEVTVEITSVCNAVE